MSTTSITPLLTSEDVAEHLGVPVRTLTQWRYLGRGPRYLVIGRHIRYQVVDIEAWQAEQAVEPAGGR